MIQWLNKIYPQNFIIKKPFLGTVIFTAFCFGFLVLYKPLNVHQTRNFNLGMTMAIYLSLLSIPIFLIIKLLKKIRYFSNPNGWTILKELLSIAIILLGMGIALYFIGFLMEISAPRWNLSTLLDSCKQAFLVGIIPFMFFTIMNYRYLFIAEIVRNFYPGTSSFLQEKSEELIRIGSQLKKEELSFFPSQFVYAKSDGNYVVFHLNINDQIRKKIIRNSINNIEQQLSVIPFIIRTHRAFIVNVRQLISQKGNSLGYRLKLNGCDSEIPVSRQNTRDFDQLIRRYE